MTDPSAEALRERNRRAFGGLPGRLYSFYIQRPRLARVVGALLWGGNTALFYDRLPVVRELPPGALVLDAPCGAGVAFAGLSPNQDLKYVALDISEGMLERAAKRARRLGLGQVELVRGDVARIPVEDASVDLFLSWWGLHCVPDPEGAVREAARCLKPGGRLIGGMICSGPRLRQRLLVRPNSGLFGPTGTPDDLDAWLERAGLTRTRLDVSGPFAYFEASA